MCDFIFDRPNAVYYSGDTVSGRVILTTFEVKSIKGIFITLKGFAKVRWSEEKSRRNPGTNRNEYYTVDYRGDEQYLRTEAQVDRGKDLPTGRHEYAFSTILPSNIPSSLSGEHGHVCYMVEVRLSQVLQKDVLHSHSFTVIKPFDLNLYPSFSTPTKQQEEIHFSCCCRSFGPYKIELGTDISGYAPGQKINFTVLMDNESNKDVEGCVVEFIQCISFKCQSPETQTKNVETVIADIALIGPLRYSKKLHKESFQVPALPPTTMGVWSLNDNLRTNIAIGTIPLVASGSNANRVVIIQPSAPLMVASERCDSPPEYSAIGPPTFEEATAGSKPFVDPEADKSQVHRPFAPKYPVFKSFAITAQ